MKSRGIITTTIQSLICFLPCVTNNRINGQLDNLPKFADNSNVKKPSTTPCDLIMMI